MATADTQSETEDFISVHLAQLTNLYNEFEKNMSSYDNVEKVKLLYGKLCDRSEEFKSVHLHGSLLLLVLDVCIYTLVQLLC